MTGRRQPWRVEKDEPYFECPRCHRATNGWSFVMNGKKHIPRRGDLCSPKQWFLCIRNPRRSWKRLRAPFLTVWRPCIARDRWGRRTYAPCKEIRVVKNNGRARRMLRRRAA